MRAEGADALGTLKQTQCVCMARLRECCAACHVAARLVYTTNSSHACHSLPSTPNEWATNSRHNLIYQDIWSLTDLLSSNRVRAHKSGARIGTVLEKDAWLLLSAVGIISAGVLCSTSPLAAAAAAVTAGEAP
jgi:hypothetical protein